jgi:hypothetical protein
MPACRLRKKVGRRLCGKALGFGQIGHQERPFGSADERSCLKWRLVALKDRALLNGGI